MTLNPCPRHKLGQELNATTAGRKQQTETKMTQHILNTANSGTNPNPEERLQAACALFGATQPKFQHMQDQTKALIGKTLVFTPADGMARGTWFAV
jgi:hypothetical protein